jgi:hypothetical protein
MVIGLSTWMLPLALVKTAMLVPPLTELHALPVTVSHPVELVSQPRELLVLVAVAALAEGARRRRERRRAKGEKRKAKSEKRKAEG